MNKATSLNFIVDLAIPLSFFSTHCYFMAMKFLSFPIKLAEGSLYEQGSDNFNLHPCKLSYNKSTTFIVDLLGWPDHSILANGLKSTINESSTICGPNQVFEFTSLLHTAISGIVKFYCEVSTSYHGESFLQLPRRL